jgi:hypothetical protein
LLQVESGRVRRKKDLRILFIPLQAMEYLAALLVFSS